jgi:hypothetical protein
MENRMTISCDDAVLALLEIIPDLNGDKLAALYNIVFDASVVYVADDESITDEKVSLA